MERKARKGFGGRPRKHEPEAGEKLHLGIRVTPRMKDLLIARATISGRSQSQEAEILLERAIDRENLLPEVLIAIYGPRIAGLLIVLGHIMRSAVRRTGYEVTLENGWADYYEPKLAIEYATRLLLEAWRPTRSAGANVVPPAMEAAVEAVKANLRVLDHEKKTKRHPSSLADVSIKALGPLLDNLIENLPAAMEIFEGTAIDKAIPKRRA